jgi:hypothetical protein
MSYPVLLNDQNDILLSKLLKFYEQNDNLNRMLNIINGTSKVSLRIVDWFSTNYSKKHYTMYDLPLKPRFKVYEDYKLKLKAYSKKRFDPFCRWDRIQIPIQPGSEYCFETTIGQLNFFKWALENGIVDYIEMNYDIIEKDMNMNNSLSKTRKRKNKQLNSENIICLNLDGDTNSGVKTRKKREELSINAVKTFKKEKVEIIVTFD